MEVLVEEEWCPYILSTARAARDPSEKIFPTFPGPPSIWIAPDGNWQYVYASWPESVRHGTSEEGMTTGAGGVGAETV